jgi:histidinol-phosphate phosphatase family protein
MSFQRKISKFRKDAKTIFIDRDGVINKDPGGWTKFDYVTDFRDFHFLPGSLEALKLLNDNGVRVIIVSNQAGVSRGHFSKGELDAVNSKMLDEIGKRGGRIEAVYYCVHRDEDNCRCRKPKAGMLEDAAKRFNIKLEEAYMIGDSHVDIGAGKTAGARTIFVLSGKMSLGELRKRGENPDHVFGDLLEAVRWILSKEKRRFARAVKRKSEA